MALWTSLYNIKTTRQKEFYKHVLEARSDFLRLRLRQEPEIREIYVRSAERVAEELKRLLKQKGDVRSLQRSRLEALERNLRAEAEKVAQGVTVILKRDLTAAANAGAQPINQTFIDALRAAKVPTDYAKVQYGFGEVNARAVEAIWARTRNGLYLSDRIWQESQTYRNTIRDVIVDAVTQGRDVVDIARDITQYVKHGARTFAGDYPKMMARMGKRIPKDICYEALRLARTEMSMAALEGTYAAGTVNPAYEGVQWMLSGSHPMPDICDDLADADLYGLGAGCYPKGDEPPHPHPNCLCFAVPLVDDDIVDRLERWLDDPQSDPELEKWCNEVYRNAPATVPARPRAAARAGLG